MVGKAACFWMSDSTDYDSYIFGKSSITQDFEVWGGTLFYNRDKNDAMSCRCIKDK